MEGRWTIWTDEDTGVANIRIKGPDMPWQPVEVVPCDDAAIERVALVLFPHIVPVAADDDAMRLATSLAHAAFRAAGETP